MVLHTCEYCPYKSIHAWDVKIHIERKHTQCGSDAPTTYTEPDPNTGSAPKTMIFQMLAIFIDLKKAFDTVDHEILLNKMAFYDARGSAQNWFKNYLSDREQFVIINK